MDDSLNIRAQEFSFIPDRAERSNRAMSSLVSWILKFGVQTARCDPMTNVLNPVIFMVSSHRVF
jgi:hypothetical protein